MTSAPKYERQHADRYFTPAWVVQSMLSAVSIDGPVWEPACGSGNIVKCLKSYGFECVGTDIYETGRDFFIEIELPFTDDSTRCHNIITNPPFYISDKFVKHALDLTRPFGGSVIMLLPHEWDTAKSRRSLVTAPYFRKKLTLTRRIRWENLEQKAAGPQKNHAWFWFDWNFKGEPTIGYLP